MLLFCFSNETDGHTPLTYAARHGHEEIVDYLLEKGSNVNGKFEGAKNYKISSWNVSINAHLIQYGSVCNIYVVNICCLIKRSI